jgi:hypothetical protein
MQLSRIRFVLWQLMAMIASVACLVASGVAFAAEPITAANVLTGWAALYGAPLFLIFARGVPLIRAAKIAWTIVLCGLPVVAFFSLLNLLTAPLVALLIGWIELMAVSLFPGALGRLVDKMYAPEPITFTESELPPLVYNPNWARLSKTRAGGFWDGHWIGFLFLLPAIVMLALHEPLGMTDAALMGDRVSAEYNLMTFAALFFGSLAFVISAVALPIVKRRGSRWVAPKIIFLICCWAVFVLVMTYKSLLHR